MFVSNLFITTKLEIIKCSMLGRQVNCVSYGHTMEYYAAIKKDKPFKCATAWLNLKMLQLMKEAKHKLISIVWFYLYKISEREKLIYNEKTNQ